MKVVFLIAPGLFAGAEAVVLAGAREARRQGMQVFIWLLQEKRVPQHTEEFARRAQAVDVPTRCFAVHGRLDWRLPARLRAALQQAGIGLVHAHGYKALLYCIGLQRKLRIPVVATHHGVTAHTWLVRCYHYLEFRLLRHCRGVFAVSQAMVSLLVDKGIRADRVYVQDNPLALDLPPLAPLREDSALPSQLAVVGRLSPEKGIEILLRALADQPEWQLRLIGDGPQRDELQQLVDTLGLSSRVEFMGFQTDVQPHLQGVDVFALPSLREGLPLALIEAAALGLPAVVSRVGATEQIVQEGQNGRVLPAGDVAAWSQALAQLRAEPALWQHMRQQARIRASEIRQRYSPAAWLQVLQRSYRKMGVVV